MVDLNLWHRAIHQVTGAMALKFNRATPTDLAQWAKMLRAVAEEMEKVAGEGASIDTLWEKILSWGYLRP
jgi:hypothetical protein